LPNENDAVKGMKLHRTLPKLILIFNSTLQKAFEFESVCVESIEWNTSNLLGCREPSRPDGAENPISLRQCRWALSARLALL
jgi:hypothetical protein